MTKAMKNSQVSWIWWSHPWKYWERVQLRGRTRNLRTKLLVNLTEMLMRVSGREIKRVTVKEEILLIEEQLQRDDEFDES